MFLRAAAARLRSLVAPGAPVAVAFAAALSLAAAAAVAAPIIEVSPSRFGFPAVTLGDTAFAPLAITNRGDAPLEVSAIDVPPGVEFKPTELPFTLQPDSTAKLQFSFEPADTSGAERALVLHSNDPATPALELRWLPDVVPIEISARALTTPGTYPLGEAIVVQATVGDRSRVEAATLFFRSGFSTRFNPQPMTPDGRTFLSIIPGSFVNEGGVEFYVVASNGAFAAYDPPDSSDRPLRVQVESPRDFKLDPVVRNPGFIWRAGETIDFLLQLERGTVYESGLLHYRRGGERGYQEAKVLEISFTGISASIPSDHVGPRGVEYWSEIQTTTTRLTNPFADPVTEPHELRITVNDLAEPAVRPAGRYRMLSIPLAMPAGTRLPAILTDEAAFGAYDPARWRAFRYQPDLQTNVEFSAERADTFRIEPGRAFWLISREAHRVDTGPVPGVSTSAADAFPLVLEPGWNQIGNPFDFPVAWSTARAPAAIGAPLAFDSARNDYVDLESGVLEPFEGYFVENTSDAPVTVLIPPLAFDTTRARPAATEGEPAPAWSLDLGARTADGVDLSNRVGLVAGAATERDAHDESEPPPAPGAAVRLAIANHGWSRNPGLYRRDFRPATGEGTTWEIEITSAGAGEAIELALRPAGPVPPGAVLRLIDRELGTAVDLAGGAAEWRHTIVSPGPGRSYRLALALGSKDYVREAPDRNVPARLTLDAAAPNPSRGPQRLRFGLPRAAAARLEVFDAAGRKVATLIDGSPLPAGFHSVLWRPDTPEGRAPNGIYFHRLTAAGETRTVRSVRVR